MAELRVRDSDGQEHRYTRDAFVQAVGRGMVPAHWEIFHSVADRWLPVSVHPAFSQTQSRGEPERPLPRRSSELVLIYPEEAEPRRVPARPPDESDDLDAAPVLTTEEIERVLTPATGRPSGPVEPEVQLTGHPRPRTAISTSELADVLLRTARRSIPTLARAVGVAAGLVAQRA